MRTKEELLAEVREGLSTGVLSEADLRVLMHTPEPVAAKAPEPKPNKLSAVDVMFYIAGIVLFAAIMSVIVESWNDGNAFMHILLSGGVGAGLWAIAYYLITSTFQSDVRKGLVNALLLTGSLCIVTGGYIFTNELIGGFDEINLLPMAFTFAVLGGMHLAFDRLIKRDLTLLMGILLSVATFPTLLFGFLQDTEVAPDVYAVILIFSAGLLAYATRVVARLNPDRQKLRGAFDWFAAFLTLLTMYIMSFNEYGVLWLVVLVGSVLGIFYLSIITQSKQLLGTGSFFMVLTVVTISFKYFSGFGVTTSLILATMGLLGSAAVASSINKKYFKQAAQKPVEPNESDR